MDAVLIILGILGFGAIGVSGYVFTVAARNYVSDDHKKMRKAGASGASHHLTARSTTDRRRGTPVTFPLTVNGIVITQDRRNLPDRRQAA